MHIPGHAYSLRKDDPGKIGIGLRKTSDYQARREAEEEDPLQVGQEGGISYMFRKKRGSLVRLREDQGLARVERFGTQ